MANPRAHSALLTTFLLLAAGFAFTPLAAGQLFGAGPDPDVIVDVRAREPATYGGLSDGTNVSPVAQPMGTQLRAQTSYDLRFVALSTEQAAGYGFIGSGATAANLVNATGTAVATAQLIPNGSGPTYNATFVSWSPAHAGVYTVRPIDGSAAGNVAAAVFVQPRESLFVSFTPNVATCSDSPDNSTLVSIAVHNATGPVSGARLYADFLPSGVMTNSNGTYVHFGMCPALGPHEVRATRDAGGPAFAGQPVPEHQGAASLTFAMAPTTLRVGHHHGGLLAPARVPVVVEGARDLGTITFTLALNASVATVDNVTAGDVNGTSTSWSYNASEGVLTVLVTTTARPGPNAASSTLVDVWIDAVGPVGSSTALDLEVIELANSDGALQPAAAVDGSFRAGILGDVDGDGVIGWPDAEALADVVTGARPATSVYPANADLNGDGALTGIDVMRLRQYLAGTRGTL